MYKLLELGARGGYLFALPARSRQGYGVFVLCPDLEEMRVLRGQAKIMESEFVNFSQIGMLDELLVRTGQMNYLLSADHALAGSAPQLS